MCDVTPPHAFGPKNTIMHSNQIKLCSFVETVGQIELPNKDQFQIQIKLLVVCFAEIVDQIEMQSKDIS